MSATIFCTFEQQDLADLAMGKIRQIPGVMTIHYIIDHAAHQRLRGAVSVMGGAMSYGLVGISSVENTATPPPQPATVKITCSDKARKTVVSTLVNLHAHKIITTP